MTSAINVIGQKGVIKHDGDHWVCEFATLSWTTYREIIDWLLERKFMFCSDFELADETGQVTCANIHLYEDADTVAFRLRWEGAEE